MVGTLPTRLGLIRRLTRLLLVLLLDGPDVIPDVDAARHIELSQGQDRAIRPPGVRFVLLLFLAVPLQQCGVQSVECVVRHPGRYFGQEIGYDVVGLVIGELRGEGRLEGFYDGKK